MELYVISSGAENFGTPKLPLSGMRVCEISHHLSAPLCGRYLSELGADVVRLEAPDRDRMRAFCKWRGLRGAVRHNQ
ncbi:CoA transferase [Roseibium sp.]|uniref:CoA transferase n=1 Tax=Roseibium sp. TaxID=1936156 RepID=UPI003A980C78